jgi:hypothetical protein
VTLYLTCDDYPHPCDAFGAGFTLTSNARYTATAPTTGPYANLAVFADRANPTPLLLATTADTTTATIYAKNARLVLASHGDLHTTGPLILARLTTLSTGSISITLDPPAIPATAPSTPVLIR